MFRNINSPLEMTTSQKGLEILKRQTRDYPNTLFSAVMHVETISPIQIQTYRLTLVHVTFKMVVIIRSHDISRLCVEFSDAPITVSTSLVSSNDPSRQAQVYSHMWPQPAGQWALLFSQFIICSRCPPWLQPWHQTNIPFTTWWHTAHMLAHWWHLERGSRLQVKPHFIKF